MEFLKIWDILLRRRWIIIGVFLFFFITVFFGLSMVPKTYEASAKILYKKNEALDLLKSSLGLTSDSDIEDDYEFETEIALASVRPLVVEFISSLELKDRSGELVDASDLIDSSPLNKLFPQPALEIEQYEESNVLEIIANSTIPEEPAKMANVFTQMYIEAQVDRVKGEYKTARTFINDQIKSVRQDYYDSMAEERAFKVKEGIVDLDQETENLIDKIEELRNEYESNARTIQSTEEEIAQTKAQLLTLNEYKLESKELTLSKQVESLETSVNEYLVSIAGIQVELQREHPDYLTLEAKLKQASKLLKDSENLVLTNKTIAVDPIYETLQTTLFENIIDKEVTKAKQEALQSYIDKYQDQLMTLPLIQNTVSRFESEITIAKDKYEKLLGYLKTVNIAESITLGNFQLIESAQVPDTPDFPKKPIVLILAILPGTFWALGLAFFIDYIDTTIKSPNDLGNNHSLGILGTLPYLKKIQRKKIILNMESQSLAEKHFRSLANQLNITLPETGSKTIMVTSSLAKEGKTCLAANLAITLSRTGKRVLLVDMNRRNPSLHTLFNLPNQKGVLQVVAGEVALEEVICSTDIATLSVIPAGSLDQDSLHWMAPDLYGPFLDSVKQQFDVVILDTASMSPDNDIINLRTLADETIWVIGAGHITPTIFSQSKELLDKANIKLAGVFFNKT